MEPFRIVLALHAPIVLPDVVPRLDRLLHEASCRLHRDWSVQHALPLAFDGALGLYRASQLIMATTRASAIRAASYARPTRGQAMDLTVTRNPREFKISGSKFLQKAGQYKAYWPPYAVFYGEGDGRQCARLLQLLDGIGREHSAGMGRFEIVDVRAAGRADAWQCRSLPPSCNPPWADTYHVLHDHEPLGVFGEPTPVIRPPRVIREVM